MHAGEVIVLKGEGDESVRTLSRVSVPSPSSTESDESVQPDSSAPGDLHLTILPLPHPTFTLLPSLGSSAPQSLSTTLSLTLSESLLGFSRLILLHLDGRALRASSPAPGEKGWRVLKTGDEVMVSHEGMWRKGETGDLVVKVEVEMPSEEWAMGLAERGGVDTLRGLMPPRREDLSRFEERKGGEVEEVVLEEVKEREEDESWVSRQFFFLLELPFFVELIFPWTTISTTGVEDRLTLTMKKKLRTAELNQDVNNNEDSLSFLSQTASPSPHPTSHCILPQDQLS